MLPTVVDVEGRDDGDYSRRLTADNFDLDH